MRLCVRCGLCAGTGRTLKQPSLLLSEVYPTSCSCIVQQVLYRGLWKALSTSLLHTALYRSARKRYLRGLRDSCPEDSQMLLFRHLA